MYEKDLEDITKRRSNLSHIFIIIIIILTYINITPTKTSINIHLLHFLTLSVHAMNFHPVMKWFNRRKFAKFETCIGSFIIIKNTWTCHKKSFVVFYSLESRKKNKLHDKKIHQHRGMKMKRNYDIKIIIYRNERKHLKMSSASLVLYWAQNWQQI